MGLFYYNTGFSKSRINVIFLESAEYGIEMKRTLNPKFAENFSKKCVFRQEFDVWCFHNSSDLASLETNRRHEFVEEF